MNELDAWRESFRENIACKKAIEEEIRNSFDGMHLDDSCVDQIIDRFGYKRIFFVLANTLKEKSYDGRFHENNLEWSRRYFIPADKEHNYQFAVESHPAVLDGFISQYRNRLDSLNLFQSDSCIPGSRTSMEFEDRVVVVHPNNPVFVVPLVEIVPGKQTDPSVIAALREFYEAIGKLPITLKKESPDNWKCTG